MTNYTTSTPVTSTVEDIYGLLGVGTSNTGKLLNPTALISSAIGSLTVADTSQIDLSYTGGQLSGTIVNGSIGTTQLSSGVNTSLGLANTAVQPAALSPYLTTATAASTYQPLDADLTAITALAETSGLLRKTAADTWSLDTATYLQSGAIGSTVLAYDANLQEFVSTFTLPTIDGASGRVLTTNGSGTLSFTAIPYSLIVACSGTTQALAVGAAKETLRADQAFTLTGVRASLTTAATGSTVIVDINLNGASVLGTKLSIDATETTSTTAASAATITTSAIPLDGEITIDIDQVGATLPGTGLKVYLLGTLA